MPVLSYEQKHRIVTAMNQRIPHPALLGITIENLLDDAEAGAFHGGAPTVLLDQTLNLRLDHLGVAPPGIDIHATGKVYRSTRKILFVEGMAYCETWREDREKPNAIAKAHIQLSETD